MEEICQRDKIMKAKIDLVKGMEILEQGAVTLYQMSLSSGTGLEEAMTDASYKQENEEAMTYPLTQNDLLKIREDFVRHRDSIFFGQKTVKDRIFNGN
ncbi:hypothetical protein CEXT_509531 [Caerostris extrusa]|uniref:Uncharacterized protein n=1 Tax=Caerostris extrusa TaxID=172846 RepID=A0AAV4Y1N1_CAEEX|nr:hypothetical protein CEXT_509531 [Caerostris extrusa]